jgi:pseudouridine-5'-phosphate glycosidase
MPRIIIHDKLREALSNGEPVVGLETAVLTHGLPRTPMPAGVPGVSPDGPTHHETMRAMLRAVFERGALPAVVAVVNGDLHVGLHDEAMLSLANDAHAEKASIANLAYVMAAGRSAGTTVSASLIGCSLAEPAPVRVFATGGIGGVHAGWTSRPDLSADLSQLARTPVCVVCAGAKSVLDLPATVEALETLGVPVVGYATDSFPRFHARTSGLPLGQHVDDAEAAAAVCRIHWETLGNRSGVILANPIPDEFALDGGELDDAVARANAFADEEHVTGSERTPFLLEELTRLTEGRTLIANIALLLNNARVAAEVAIELARKVEPASG